MINHFLTLQKFANQLAEPARKNDTNATNALKSLEKIDPTTNKQFTLWLIKQFIKGQFRLEDSSRVQQVLQNFTSVKSRLPVEQRDRCTAARENNRFSYYSKEGPLYIWIDKSGEKYQFHFETCQFMDDKDRLIEDILLKYFRTEHSVLKSYLKKKKEIAKDPERAYEYATDVIRGKFPEGEAAIAKDAYYSYHYAKQI